MRVRDRWQNLVWLKSLSTDLHSGERDMRDAPARFPRQEQCGVHEKIFTLAECHGVAIDISLSGLHWSIRCVPAKLKERPKLPDISLAYTGQNLDDLLYAAILDYEEIERGNTSVRTTPVYTERSVLRTYVAPEGVK